jgi:hypothetical protein
MCSGDHVRERIEGVVRMPHLDVDRVLLRTRGAPGREVVHVVEDQPRSGNGLPCGGDQVDERLGDVDGHTVGSHRPLRVAVLVEVEPVEPDRIDRRGELAGEAGLPVLGGRVDEEEEVAERIGSAARRQQGIVPPVAPLLRADRVHRGVAQRPGADRLDRVRQRPHGVERNGLAERIVVEFAAAEQVGMAVRPVVELDVGEVQAAHGVGEAGRVASGAEVHGEAVPHPRFGTDEHRGARHGIRGLQLDAVAAGRQCPEADVAAPVHDPRDLVAQAPHRDRAARVAADLDDDLVAGLVAPPVGQQFGHGHPFSAPAARPCTK